MKVYLLSYVDYDGFLWDVYATPEAAKAAFAVDHPGVEWVENVKTEQKSWDAKGPDGRWMNYEIAEREVLS